MSLNVENIGRKIATITGSKKYKNTTISVSETTDDIVKPFDEFKLDEGKFQYIPDKNRDRDTIFITGAAGSGKSYFAGKYLQEYRKVFKDAPIYIFSEGKEDSALDNIKGTKRIPLDDDLLQNPIQWQDFEGPCCVVFDDIDALKGPMFKYTYDLRDKCLKNARKNKVSVVSTSHLATGADLRAVLNESNVIVFFMQNYNRALKYLIDNYIGINKQGVRALKQRRSRWTAFIKSYPNVILQEQDILTLSKLQDF